jgi:cell division protein FtsA
MAREQIHVGLEIGTSKICAVVAESRGEAHPIRILGVGESPSRGVRKGEIVDFSTASKCVHEALADAEEKSDVEIRSVWASVTGSHLVSFNNRGAVVLADDKNEIDESDLRDVELNAKEVTIPAQNEFLHTIIQHYYVDGQQGVLDPVGMVGQKLEADFHIVHGVCNRIKNTIRCIKEAGVEVEDVVVNSLASAQVVVTPQQKDLGVIVLDIGGGVTDFIVYVDGAVRHSGVLAIGGDHITNDLSIGLRIPITRAEKLKCEEGSCITEGLATGETIVLKSDAGFSGCEIERSVLNLIIRVRMEELFRLLRKRIESVVPVEMIGEGVVITGGTSQLRGLRSLAAEVFDVPARLAIAQDVSGPTSAYENPALSTPIGLVKYAQAVSAELEDPGLLNGLFSIFRRK